MARFYLQYPGTKNCCLRDVISSVHLSLAFEQICRYDHNERTFFKFLSLSILRLHELLCCQANKDAVFFVFGAASKFTATVLTYPLQLIQTRTRVSSKM
jgi:hypothetical protein